MFHQGMEIIFVTAAQQVPSNFSIYVEEFRRHLIAPHILALSVQTSKLFSPLARDGWLYSIPTWTKTPLVAGTKHWNPQTWIIDTMQSIYSRMRSYRAKVSTFTQDLIFSNNYVLIRLRNERSNCFLDGLTALSNSIHLQLICCFHFIISTMGTP